MNKILILLAIAFVKCTTLSAQILVSTNNAQFNGANNSLPIVGGRPVDQFREITLTEGTPFFDANWNKSIVITKEGVAYRDIPIRLNLMSQKTHFLDANGKELLVGMPLGELIYVPSNTKDTIHFINGSLLPMGDENWYQLLVNHKITLVKGFKKTLDERTSYGSGPEYSIKTVETYLAFYKDQKYEVRKAADLIKMLPEKKESISSFIKSNDKLPREALLIATVKFCNSLL